MSMKLEKAYIAYEKKYGIGVHRIVEQWVKKYGRAGYRSELVIIQTVDDQLEVNVMKQRIAELEAALAQSVLDNRMLTTIIDVASPSLEIDRKIFLARDS